MSKSGTLYEDGSRRWIHNGKLHRLDGPAITNKSGSYQSWHYNGKLHRDGGPAIIRNDDFEMWYQHDKKHRLDGPAIVYKYNSNKWWINDQEITSEVQEWITENNIPSWKTWTDTDKLMFRMKFQ